MHLRLLGVLALPLVAVKAFKDTSPFFLFSTSELLTQSRNVISAPALNDIVLPQIQKCSSDTYVIVSQPSVQVEDYAGEAATPHLRKMMRGEEESVRSSLSINSVYGALDVESLAKVIEDKCNAVHLRIDASTGSFSLNEEKRPQVINVEFPALPQGKVRTGKLIENDAFLASLLSMLPTDKFTVLYTTSPPISANDKPNKSKSHSSTTSISESYKLEDTLYQSPLHQDLKRDFLYRRADGEDDGTDNRDVKLPEGPLFERYTFLSPGLFMGLLTGVILLSILYAGMSGLGSLTVTYASFDKDMGPAAQKKQQ